MADPAYPDTKLRVGKRDARFGGQPADDWGGPAWAFHDNAIQELERQQIQALWSAATVTRARVASSGVAGDFILFVDDGASDLYTLKTVAALVAGGGSYDAVSTPRFGLLAAPCSAYAAAGDEPLIILSGLVPPNVHGLNPGASGYAVMNTTTGRLAMSDGTAGEIIVGRLNTKGYLYLFPRTGTNE